MKMAERTKPVNVVKQIRKATAKKFSAEDKIRIVLEGLRAEIPITELCRREGISAATYYKWSKDWLLTIAMFKSDVLNTGSADSVAQIYNLISDLLMSPSRDSLA
jgi:transposase-like protein